MARSAVALKAVEPNETFASVMQQLSDIYVATAPYKAKIKKLEEDASTLKASAIEMMDSQGVKKTSTKFATISITELERVVIDDVTLMLKALKRDGWEHVLTLNVAAAKEYMEKKGKVIPGTHVGISSRFIKLSGIK